MTNQRNDAANARAAAVFHLPVTETKAAPDPLAEYRAKQDAGAGEDGEAEGDEVGYYWQAIVNIR